jgi:anti-sigma factor RsiW
VTSGGPHAGEMLGPYALGVLDAEETRAVESHLASCAQCRDELAGLAALTRDLGEVPPEAFLDGPPEGGDLLLRRALQTVRGELSRSRRQRVWLAAAGVAVLAAAALGGGVVLGRQGAAPVALPSPSASATPAGTRVLAASDPRTGASLRVVITPATGWVRLRATVSGVRPGLKCQLLVLPRGGAAVVAGSWLATARAQRSGVTLDGAALVAPADVTAVQVTTLDGTVLVSAPV